MDKIAAKSGASTRTLYERFRNKAELLAAVINRLVERLATVLATADLDRLDPRAALTVIADTLVARAYDPDSAALFRIMATESHRFPELAAKMRASDKRCVDAVVANYFRTQVKLGVLVLPDPDKAASLFLQMICSELHECLLFGDETALARLDMKQHTAVVVDMFLLGAVPR
jgi:AcrR family transcriptional regulator